MKILIVEDDPASRGALRETVASEGHEVVTASDGDAGLAAFDELGPDLVLADVRMPKMGGLELLAAIRERSADAIVVMITGYGCEEYAAKALRLRASNYLSKPVRRADLLRLLAKYAGIAKSRAAADKVPAMIVRHELTITFGNHLELIPSVADHLATLAPNALDEEAQQDVRLGLNELLINAVEHGNLGITYEEKTAAMERGSDVLTALRDARLTDAVMGKRRVSVDFGLGEHVCEWVISDEGDGFDWRAVPDPLDEDNLLKPLGRGMFLCRFLFDEMEYEGPGNIVRVRKRIQRRG